ncbi:glycoside hydrolase family 25 protein [Rhizobium johnstonii]|uniref:glycoside hydrolase family 25 protein n=1 Tax=Rhizobium TaxID=379 RepID=UPI001C985C9B|nr:GH25 family lysozyme [Rhizobium leguminosarum]MBY5775951.1 glycoside hydrolase [Rhizobium leguminosarum]
MKTMTLACIVVLTIFPLPSGAEELTEASWQELTDDTSRATLFEDEIVPARLAENEKLESDPTISLNIPKEFWFPDDAKFDKVLNKPRDQTLFGVDISHHNGKVSFKNFRLQHISFVYMKATQGVRFKDGKFGTYWSDIAALEETSRLYRGAYHFLSANGSAEDQAKSFVDYITLHGGLKPGDLPPCLDLEWDRTSTNPDQWRGQDPDAILTKTLKWLKIVEDRTGRKPILYTARSWWRERIKDEKALARFDGYHVWIADYSTSHKAAEKPAIINGKEQKLWQFTDNALMATGYNRGIDGNIYYGTPDTFEVDFGIAQ